MQSSRKWNSYDKHNFEIMEICFELIWIQFDYDWV